MALSDLTFKLYNDASLISEFGGTLNVTHQSDLSDNSQDFVLYFGSVTTGVQLQTTVNPGVDNINITPTDTLDAWVLSTAYVIGDSREPTVDNGYRYVVSVAGTSDTTEPTWPTAIGSTILDGGAVWTCTAKTHEPTEIKLASTNAGLDSATAGAALSFGNTVLSEAANLKELHIRVTNTVTNVSSNTADPEIGLFINDVTETTV